MFIGLVRSCMVLFYFPRLDLPGVLVFEPEPVRLPQPLELLLDDGGEERSRISVQRCLEHSADVDVDVVDVPLVDFLELEGDQRLINN